MKIIFSFLLVSITALLSGCGIFNIDISESDSRGSSPENLVPLGEYVDICPDDRDVQLCILEIISGDEAKRLFDTDKELVITKFNMKAVSLNGEEFCPPSNVGMVLNNVTIKTDYFSSDAEEIFGISYFRHDTFATEGSIDCVAVFWVDIDECRYLKYGDSTRKNETYFAIRN